MHLNELVAQYRETNSDEDFERLLQHEQIKKNRKILYKRRLSQTENKSVYFEALMRSLKTFDANKSTIVTYIRFWHRSYVQKALAFKGIQLKINSAMIQKYYKYVKYVKKNPDYTLKEIREDLDIGSRTIRTFNAIETVLERTKSLDQELNFDIDRPDEIQGKESKKDYEDFHNEIKDILDDRELKYIKKKYFEGMTLERIAEDEEITHQRIQQIIKRAVQKLKDNKIRILETIS